MAASRHGLHEFTDSGHTVPLEEAESMAAERDREKKRKEGEKKNYYIHSKTVS